MNRPPCFRRGAKAILEWYNGHAAEPIDERALYKLISRGTLDVGKDGASLLGEESKMLASLLRNASAAKK
jgi:hypothetical protein